MAVSGTNKTLTVDANVINYCFCFKNGHPLSSELNVQRIEDFYNSVIEKYPIATNKFIKTEYEQLIGTELAKSWLKERLKKDLAIEVESLRLPNDIKKQLSKDYGFDCNSRDVRYLQTCQNTIFKRFVTQNTEHFCRPFRHSSKRQTMRNFLKRKLNLLIYTIDEACEKLLNN